MWPVLNVQQFTKALQLRLPGFCEYCRHILGASNKAAFAISNANAKAGPGHGPTKVSRYVRACVCVSLLLYLCTIKHVTHLSYVPH